MDDIIEFSFWCLFWIHGKKPYVPIFTCYFISYKTPDLQSVPIKFIPPFWKNSGGLPGLHTSHAVKKIPSHHMQSKWSPSAYWQRAADSGEHGYRREGYSSNRKCFKIIFFYCWKWSLITWEFTFKILAHVFLFELIQHTCGRQTC